MNHKEKAQELVIKFEAYADYNSCDLFTERENMRKNAKQCALIACDEIIKACEYNHVESYNTDWWQKVKDEINKL